MNYDTEYETGNPRRIADIFAAAKIPEMKPAPSTPLTPVACDLRSFGWMKLDVGNLLSSEMWTVESGDACKADLLLRCEAWHQVPAGSLPDDDRMLKHYSRAGASWKRIRELVMKNWIKCSDGRLYHPEVSAQACEAWEQKKAQKAKTEAARRALKEKRAVE